jgi:hypothetical protein
MGAHSTHIHSAKMYKCIFHLRNLFVRENYQRMKHIIYSRDSSLSQQDYLDHDAIFLISHPSSSVSLGGYQHPNRH